MKSGKSISCHELYKEVPKTRRPDDFWGQVARTVNGKPVGQDQIDLIVAKIRASLQFAKTDSVLDIGCGNGALSQYFFAECGGWLGVDYSEYLIQVAKEHFEQPPSFVFQGSDAAQFIESGAPRLEFNKALCYGTFAYFSEDQAVRILKGLRSNYPNVTRLFVGNLPDRDLAAKYYTNHDHYESLLDEANSSIGLWRSRAQFTELAKSCGWSAEFSEMPASFFAHHYRYDVLLTPRKVNA